MKKTILTAFLSLIISLSFSQDVIYKRDNTKVEAKIIEINPTQIKYKMFDYPDGPLYIINKSEVIKIQYPNGQVDIYNPEIRKEETPSAKDENGKKQINAALLNENFKRNVVSVNLLQAMLGYLSVSYEWIDPNGMFGIKIPLGYNFANYSINLAGVVDGSKSSYFGGLALNIYPKRKKRISYFVGPYLQIGQFSYSTYNYNYYGSQTYNDGLYYACYINNGLEVVISKDFILRRPGYYSEYCSSIQQFKR